jgi:integrase
VKAPSRGRPPPRGPSLIKALAAHLAEFLALEPAGLIFHEGTRSLRRNAFATIWHTAADPVRRGTSPHDMRHAYASLLIRHGADVKLVQARMGHTSATTTLDTYGHLWPDSDDRTRTAIDAAFETTLNADSTGEASRQ